MRKALGFGLAAVLPFWLAGALLTSQPLTSSQSAIDAHDESSVMRSPDLSRSTSVTDDADEEGSRDLHGNPVSSAVATYKFDATGSLYETHSPQTELPRLAPPKS